MQPARRVEPRAESKQIGRLHPFGPTFNEPVRKAERIREVAGRIGGRIGKRWRHESPITIHRDGDSARRGLGVELRRDETRPAAQHSVDEATPLMTTESLGQFHRLMQRRV